MQQLAKRRKRKPEAIPMRVARGAFIPADGHAQKRLRQKKLAIDDVVFVYVRKARVYWYHKMVHLFGEMVAQNIDDFRGMEAHQVLKRLQAEAQVGCDELAMRLEDGQKAVMFFPRSLAYDEMDQEEFEQVFRAFVEHVYERYWPDLQVEPDRLAAMLEFTEANIQ